MSKEQVGFDARAIYILEEYAGSTLTQVLIGRLKLLMSSGIYQLWSKWHATKSEPQWAENALFKLLRNEGKQAEPVYPISMDTNVRLAFYIYIGGCLLSTIIFLMEKLILHFSVQALFLTSGIVSLLQQIRAVYGTLSQTFMEVIERQKIKIQNTYPSSVQERQETQEIARLKSSTTSEEDPEAENTDSDVSQTSSRNISALPDLCEFDVLPDLGRSGNKEKSILDWNLSDDELPCRSD